MNDASVAKEEMAVREKELYRLMVWAKNNPKDWRRICNPDSYSPDVAYISSLVEKLYKEGLLTLMFFVLHTNQYVKGVDWAISRTTDECLLDIPVQILVERFRKNLEIGAQIEAQKKKEKQPQNE